MNRETNASDEAACTCPSGDGSLRWPCPAHPNATYGRLFPQTPIYRQWDLDMVLPLQTSDRAAYRLELPHYDDIAIDHFAAAMKVKMGRSRAKGRSGWDDPEQCSLESLQAMLLKHLAKGDPVDVANFCMMLWIRNGATSIATTGELAGGGNLRDE